MADVCEEADLGDEVVDHDEEHDDDDADNHERVREKREGAARGVDLGGDVEAAESEGLVRGATGEEHFEIWKNDSGASAREAGVGLVDSVEIVVEGDDEGGEEEENSDAVQGAEDLLDRFARMRKIDNNEHLKKDTTFFF